MRKRSKHTNITSQQKNLSIQLSLDGFSFCISDSFSKAYIVFTEYTFERTLTAPELLLDTIVSIFNEDKYLQQDFNNIHVIHVNNLSTIVPNAFFDKNTLKSYLDYNIKTLTNDHITFDELSIIKAKNIYIPYVNINNYLFQNFGSFEFEHHSTVLINKLLTITKDVIDKKIFVNVFKNSIDITVIEEDKLIFFNSFTFNTKEDFIYYILFVAEQLEMNPNEFNLTFLGDIDSSSENYQITYTYIRNIDFIKTNTDFFTDTEDFSNHTNYLLIS